MHKNQKMKKIFILLIVFIFSITFFACKQTEEDLRWQEILTNKKWETVGTDKKRVAWMPIFEFNEKNRGKSYLHLQSANKDAFGWEVRRKEMRLYYDKAPMEYQIGQDQYNSKALFRVRSANDSLVEVTHLSKAGYETDYTLRKIIE